MNNLSKCGVLVLFLVSVWTCNPPADGKVEGQLDFFAQSREGMVVKIIDGDTYDVIRNGIQTRVRMDGIDAPERGMDYYKVSKDYLGSLCMNKKIRLQVSKKDRYGRLIAKTYLPDGREAGQELVKAGMAWHFKKYSSDATLARLEREARAARRGLWSAGNPIAPWDFRKQKRK